MQQYEGVILHHSVCSAINGKGYDFWVGQDGTILPTPMETTAKYIHICLEGDFSIPRHVWNSNEKEQLFVLCKLIIQLSRTYGFQPDDVYAHRFTCPGPYFPWSELVISPKDGYH